MGDWSFGGWGECPQEILQKHPKINVSGLMALYESPAHYESRYILKESEETKAMAMGTAIHMAALEPQKFFEKYCTEPDVIPSFVARTADDLKQMFVVNGLKVSGNTKAAYVERLNNEGVKAMLYEDFINDYAAGRTILSPKEMRACFRIVGRIDQNDNLKFFINGGEPEKLGWAIHERTQTVVTFKPDYFKSLHKEVLGCRCVAVDLKKVPNVRKRRFESLIWDRAMFIQAALYVDLIEALTQEKTMFMWLAVESSPPFTTMGYTADFGMLEAGKNEYNKTLTTFRECHDKNEWPVYSKELQNVTLPTWAWNALEYTDDEFSEGE